MEGHIPVGVGDLPIDVAPLDESVVYNGILKKAALSPKLSVKGVMFGNVQVEVADGDFEGQIVSLNYLPIPQPIREDMTKGERIRTLNQATQFERFCRSFKIDKPMPVVRFGDAESMSNWQDWISQFYESTGKFTVKNQEFPEGSNRLRSGIADFIF